MSLDSLSLLEEKKEFGLGPKGHRKPVYRSANKSTDELPNISLTTSFVTIPVRSGLPVLSTRLQQKRPVTPIRTRKRQRQAVTVYRRCTKPDDKPVWTSLSVVSRRGKPGGLPWDTKYPPSSTSKGNLEQCRVSITSYQSSYLSRIRSTMIGSQVYKAPPQSSKCTITI